MHWLTVSEFMSGCIRRSWHALLAGIVGFTLLSGGELPPPASARPAVTFQSAVGKRVLPVRFLDTAGRSHMLGSSAELPAMYFFLSTQCPLSNRYSSRMVAYAQAYRKRGVHSFAVVPNPAEFGPALWDYLNRRGLVAPALIPVLDTGGLTSRLGATVTPQVVVLDQFGRIRYRGRIDDNSDPGKVRQRDLQSALDAILDHRSVPNPENQAVGCQIETVLQRGFSTSRKGRMAAMHANVGGQVSVTYTRQIAPLLGKYCVPCHRAGEIAPFPLDTYAQAARWAQQIRSVAASRRMPPWKADSHGEFVDERRLTDPQIRLLKAWIDAGAPRGDARAPLPALKPTPPWKLGAPDAVLGMDAPFRMAADGADVYRCFVIPTNFPEDRYIAGVDFHPGNRRVVHHILAYIDTTGAARALAAKEPGPGYAASGGGPGFVPTGFMTGWAPGMEPHRLPPGIGILLPKGADIVLEVHYHKDGVEEIDRSTLGVYFCREPVQKRLQVAYVVNPFLQIPAGSANHIETASKRLQEDITILGVMPHMHLLGREMTVSVQMPDGHELSLVHVADWDFNWQSVYMFKQPRHVPKGSLLKLRARYDNSAQNPNNPNHPPKRVTWGEQTTDEMCIAFIGYTVDSEDLREASVSSRK